jgi:hypothetical protein
MKNNLVSRSWRYLEGSVLDKLVEELSTIALTEFDAYTRFKAKMSSDRLLRLYASGWLDLDDRIWRMMRWGKTLARRAIALMDKTHCILFSEVPVCDRAHLNT